MSCHVNDVGFVNASEVLATGVGLDPCNHTAHTITNHVCQSPKHMAVLQCLEKAVCCVEPETDMHSYCRFLLLLPGLA